MPYYMVQAAYTSDSWAAQIKNPQDRAAQLRSMIESGGGRLLEFFYTFGEYDAVLIIETPGNVDAASLMIGAAGAGAVSSIRTTVLLSPEEGLQAIRGAGSAGYSPPG